MVRATKSRRLDEAEEGEEAMKPTLQVATKSVEHSVEEDDDAPPEEASNVVAKKVINVAAEKRAAEKKASADTKRKASLARKAQKDVKSASEKEVREATVDDAEKEEAQPALSSSSSAQRLDPALFAASFAEPARRKTDEDLAKRATKTIDGKSQKKRKRDKGVARGRDGQPMRRLQDGRTTVRVLASEPSALSTAHVNGADAAAGAASLDTGLQRPAALDRAQAMPSAKARRFKQRALGLNGTQATAAPVSRALAAPKSAAAGSGKMKRRTEEDPLGLEDPAFMKGGEMAHLGLSAVVKTKKKKRKTGGTKTKNESTLRRGDVGRRGPTTSSARHTLPLHFARSA